MHGHDERLTHHGGSSRRVGSGSVRRLSLAAILACSVFVVHIGAAAAYFSTTGAGNGSVQAANIVGPSGIVASQSGTTVTVSWSAATLTSGVAVQGYKVTRSDGTVICGGTTLVTTLSCTDSNPPSGTYTYAVDAVYNSWDSSASSPSITILTAPTISSEPANPINSTSASFSFNGGNGTAYQCKLDSGAYAACTSPAAYSSLSQGSHTFSVEAANGSSSGPATSYTWLVDTVPPTQALALANGAVGAYLSGSTLYFRGSVAGSFKLVDTVSDSGSGPASAAFPNISTGGWTHAAETVSTPSGGPYTSSTFSWTASPGTPALYTTTAKDLAGNSGTTSLTFVVDSNAPTGGALTVNGTAASAAGSTSQISNSTNFTIGSRTDYSDGGGSGLKSSVLTVQSESLAGTTCGAPGSGGPFTTATTVTGTTQPPGIVAGACYVYTLTGTDNVGNTASIKTTVVDNAVSFQVTQPSPAVATAGTAFSVTLTAIKNGATDTTYTGAALSWSGDPSSPSGTAPTLPANPTWTNGVATFNVTLTDAVSTTLGVSDGTRSATFAPITVSPGTFAQLAWTSPSTTSPAGIPSPCLFTCTYASGFGHSQTWAASVSVTDALGNVVSNLGVAVTVNVTLGGSKAGTVTPATITIPATGAATSTAPVQYKSPASGNYTDTLTLSVNEYGVDYSSQAASFTQ
ncbi:MAG TPA: hypothetical protein VMD09_14150 [Solirubrobacteraceae bacterium]|nr:hypothetical protein [Solirubrobacteraceae bacterium]